MKSHASSYAPSPDAMFQRIGDEAVILDVRSGQYFGLNAIGALTWQLLSEGCTVEGAARRVVEQYDAEPEAVLSDVQSLVTELLRHGLLVSLGPSGAH